MSFYRRSDVVYGFSASALGRKFFRLGGLTFYLQAPFLTPLSPAARKSATIRAKKKREAWRSRTHTPDLPQSRGVCPYHDSFASWVNT